MNEKQQKLYDKLLKKVNEFCLGQAAEDVIKAIDDLVENYEKQLDVRYAFVGSRMCGKNEEMMRRARIVEKLETLEVLVECFDFDGFDELVPNKKWFEMDFEQRNKYKEMFEDESTN